MDGALDEVRLYPSKIVLAQFRFVIRFEIFWNLRFGSRLDSSPLDFKIRFVSFAF